MSTRSAFIFYQDVHINNSKAKHKHSLGPTYSTCIFFLWVNSIVSFSVGVGCFLGTSIDLALLTWTELEYWVWHMNCAMTSFSPPFHQRPPLPSSVCCGMRIYAEILILICSRCSLEVQAALPPHITKYLCSLYVWLDCQGLVSVGATIQDEIDLWVNQKNGPRRQGAQWIPQAT